MKIGCPCPCPTWNGDRTLQAILYQEIIFLIFVEIYIHNRQDVSSDTEIARTCPHLLPPRAHPPKASRSTTRIRSPRRIQTASATSTPGCWAYPCQTTWTCLWGDWKCEFLRWVEVDATWKSLQFMWSRIEGVDMRSKIPNRTRQVTIWGDFTLAPIWRRLAMSYLMCFLWGMEWCRHSREGSFIDRCCRLYAGWRFFISQYI